MVSQSGGSVGRWRSKELSNPFWRRLGGGGSSGARGRGQRSRGWWIAAPWNLARQRRRSTDAWLRLVANATRVLSVWSLAPIPGQVASAWRRLARCGARGRLPSRGRWPRAPGDLRSPRLADRVAADARNAERAPRGSGCERRLGCELLTRAAQRTPDCPATATVFGGEPSLRLVVDGPGEDLALACCQRRQRGEHAVELLARDHGAQWVGLAAGRGELLAERDVEQALAGLERVACRPRGLDQRQARFGARPEAPPHSREVDMPGQDPHGDRGPASPEQRPAGRST